MHRGWPVISLKSSGQFLSVEFTSCLPPANMLAYQDQIVSSDLLPNTCPRAYRRRKTEAAKFGESPQILGHSNRGRRPGKRTYQSSQKMAHGTLEQVHNPMS